MEGKVVDQNDLAQDRSTWQVCCEYGNEQRGTV